jgi:hypothetical protein
MIVATTVIATMTVRWSTIPYHLPRVLVIAQPDELCVPQVIRSSPL